MKTKAEYEQLLKNPFIRAGLDTIAKAEGVKYGYNTLYGNTKFNSLDKHPNIRVTKWGITSTASGRYQFLYRTWIDIAKKLNLTSFSPKNQDIGALYLLDQKGALDDLEKGKVINAFYKARKVWASFPSAGYKGQGERSKEQILKWYNELIKNNEELIKKNVKNIDNNLILPISVILLIFAYSLFVK